MMQVMSHASHVRDLARSSLSQNLVVHKRAHGSRAPNVDSYLSMSKQKIAQNERDAPIKEIIKIGNRGNRVMIDR